MSELSSVSAEQRTTAKSVRIDIRTTENAKNLLQEAAIACHKNLSEFLLEQGLSKAEQVLADQRVFQLTDAEWQEFQRALDRPTQVKPELRALLNDPSVFDK